MEVVHIVQVDYMTDGVQGLSPMRDYSVYLGNGNYKHIIFGLGFEGQDLGMY